MKNIIPIRVERAIPTDYNFIEWKLHNVCNYNCSFCMPTNKNGDERWLTLDEYKAYTDKLLSMSDKPLWIQVTGGEPTLYPELFELLSYMKSKGIFISMISNGTRTLRYWEELKNLKLLDHLFITYHSMQTDNYRHTADILNLFLDQGIEIFCLITHEISSIDKSLEAYDYIIENTGAITIVKAMMIADYDIYSLYTEKQAERFKSIKWTPGKKRKYFDIKINLPQEMKIQQLLKVTYDDKSVKYVDPQDLMKSRQNIFKGWQCDIGNNNMRIDYTTVYRGVCEEGGKRNLSDHDLNFTTDFITCNRDLCFCGTDMVATKFKQET